MNTSLSKLICLVLRAILYFGNKAIHFNKVSNHQIVKPTKIEEKNFIGVLGKRQFITSNAIIISINIRMLLSFLFERTS